MTKNRATRRAEAKQQGRKISPDRPKGPELVEGQFRSATVSTQEMGSDDDFLSARMEIDLVFRGEQVNGHCVVKQVVGTDYHENLNIEMVEVSPSITQEMRKGGELRNAAEAYMKYLVGELAGGIQMGPGSTVGITNGEFMMPFPFRYYVDLRY